MILFGHTCKKKEISTMVTFKQNFYNRLLIYPADLLPFDFQCGLVGYFGYEMKHESLATESGLLQHATHPDAYLLFADRLIVVDHQLNDVYLLEFSVGNHDESWLQHTLTRIQQLDTPATSHTTITNEVTSKKGPLDVCLLADYSKYSCKYSRMCYC